MGFHVGVVWANNQPSVVNETYATVAEALEDAKHCLEIDPEATVTITGGK